MIFDLPQDFGAVLADIPLGHRQTANGLAAGHGARRCEHGFATVFEDAATGAVIARFADTLEHIVTHPSSCRWAGSAGNHVYLIALEGQPNDQAKAEAQA